MFTNQKFVSAHSSFIIIFSLIFSGFQPSAVSAQGQVGSEHQVNAGSIVESARVLENDGSGNVFAVTTWYVSTLGNDADSCTSTGYPCLTINGALDKAVGGDMIKVAIGTYTSPGTGFGSEVARILKSISLSGGWNAAFTAQDGMSTIDGQGLSDHNGVYTSDFATITVNIDRFIVTNAYQGIHNGGNSTLTVNNSIITSNNSIGIYDGGPSLNLNNSSVIGNIDDGIRIDAGGNVVLVSNSLISGNNGTGIYYSGSFSPSLTINNSAISNNAGGGLGIRGSVFSSTSVIINNSTIANNTTATIDVGGGVRLYNDYGINLNINNSTISGNSANSGGGLYTEGVINTVTFRNTILANNTAATSPDCFGTINTSDHNIIGDTAGCTVTAGTGDKFNVNPLLGGYLIGTPAYFALSSGSPAINAGNPSSCLPTDQRGIARPQGVACDIGAFEYTTPGAAVSLIVVNGNNQSVGPLLAFPLPLKTMALDNQGSPVPGLNITFTAPPSGASGTFANTGNRITTALTDTNGVATTSVFTANNLLGAYTVSASASGAGSVSFNLQNKLWYVATTGNDANTCTSTASPCLTINGAISKAAIGDTINVAGGTYIDASAFVVNINKNITLSGSWDPTFTSRSTPTIIDGQNARGGIAIGNTAPSTVASIEYFQVENSCSGILNYGLLTLQNSTIMNNKNDNVCGYAGGGIGSYGTLIIKNSTISGNTSSGLFTPNGAGIYINGGSVDLNNVTLTENISTNQGGGIYIASGTVTIRNTILAGNTALSAPDCSGIISSSGYNLIGDNSGCTLSPTSGDQVGTNVNPINPRLTPLLNNAGPTLTHGLYTGSLAIDTGNPSVPGSGGNACLAVDQRSIARPVNTACDIGAFEGEVPAFDISGNTGVADVTLNYLNAVPRKVTANSAGDYTIPVPSGWSGVVTPSRTGYTFAPTNITYTNVLTNQTSQDYTATLITFTISGNAGVGGAALNYIDGSPKIATADGSGLYSFMVPYGWSGTVTPSKPAYIFSPANKTYNNLTENQVSQNYFASFGNPIGDPSFEAYTPNPYWSESSINFGTPLCTLTDCGDGGGTALPRTGSAWAWFGGVPIDEAASVSQTFSFPAGIPTLKLQFYFRIGAAGAGSDATDMFTAQVDGVTVFSANATQIGSYPNYTPILVDVSAWADGSAHTINFSSVTTGQLVTFNLDDVALTNATFFDVPSDYWSMQFIERLYKAGITGGCTAIPLKYCPTTSVTRAQMAIFLLRGIHGSAYTPPPATGTKFTDVPLGTFGAAWIEQLAAEGITSGCGGGNYCPNTTVSRAQMAIFLVRAKHGSTFVPPTATGVFGDVPIGSFGANFIEQLVTDSITSGCGSGNFCPNTMVKRDSMAVFLVKTFNLP